MLTALLASCCLVPIEDLDGLEHFEKKIRPVLVEHCYECHSGDRAEVKGGLSLDHREGLWTGGDSGPAVIAGEPHNSRLIAAIR